MSNTGGMHQLNPMYSHSGMHVHNGIAYIPSGAFQGLLTYTEEALAGADPAVWQVPSKATASDNDWAFIALVGNPLYSKYLQGVELSSSRIVPPTATITGIEVKIERNQTVGTDILDHVLKLVKGGTVQGNDLASATAWPDTTDSIATYGDSTNMWGLSLTPADVNASDFGVALSVETASAGGGLANVDHIQMAVHYT